MIEVICILLLIIAGLFKGEHESIVRNKMGITPKHILWNEHWLFPKFLRNWWTANNWKYENKIVQWLMRYPLSMLKDGYHWTAFVYEILLIATPLLYLVSENKLVDPTSHVLLSVFIIYFIFGFWANVSYHDGDLF